ncbi:MULTISPECIES: Rieske (2Fe-2S) protein [Micromonospora]|uniref:Cytochrome bc1 complex Rieske iron-sulfur subunit n=1 Tax=Micromonospora yangpuensis TaxID=683228 RepID=A0A1C6UFZ8_9ACTN|nr:Rieske (2Fe-2S) protein [Micromonospora yangpuensis]GGM05409.1 iron-sulfur protein [Micromonospora yangpuensis]SCL52894.1 Ferredoxin subunit of nitrite reductase or a ring-hydroxylating dioxygenase [Micromonospora yangpuensis]
MSNDVPGRSCPPRRALLAGACAVGVTAALAGCQTYGTAPVAAPGGPAPAPDGSGGTAAPDGAPAPALAALADIPVGGGKIFADEKVVVTRPTAETVKAFSATCTHQGCTVTEVTDGTIVCACHNSVFDIADGSVRGGPARAPLPAANVAVDGDTIRLA